MQEPASRRLDMPRPDQHTETRQTLQGKGRGGRTGTKSGLSVVGNIEGIPACIGPERYFVGVPCKLTGWQEGRRMVMATVWSSVRRMRGGGK